MVARPLAAIDARERQRGDTGSSLDTGTNYIRVTRRNNVTLKGGAGISYFKIHYHVESQVVVQ